MIGPVDDHLVELTISVVLAYGSYILADQVHLSGVIATVTAAIVLGNVGPGRALTETGSDAIDTVWEFFAYLLTAVVFLLVGLAIPPARLLDSIVPIAWAIVGDPDRARARRSTCCSVVPRDWRVARAWPSGLPTGWLHVLFWAGLRGAVAVAMALSLPADIPQRDLLQEITFGVVLFTLLGPGDDGRPDHRPHDPRRAASASERGREASG